MKMNHCKIQLRILLPRAKVPSCTIHFLDFIAEQLKGDKSIDIDSFDKAM